MKVYKKSVFAVILLTLVNISCIKAYPFKFDEGDRNTLITAASIMGLAYQLGSSELEPLSLYKIDALMERKLYSFNQFAVDNYNNDLALASDILLGVCIAIPAFQIFDGRVSPEWGTYGMMFIETGLFTAGATTITKNIIRDPRPYVYNKDVPIEEKITKDARQSFFSGHSALAFAGMTFFAQTYSKFYPTNSNHNLIWLGSMSLASATAILRVLSGRHFPIDIIVGAAVGILVGNLIPDLHKNDQQFLELNRINRIASFSINF